MIPSNDTTEEKTECDNITAVELQRVKRVLYFSDGVEEFFDSDCDDELDAKQDMEMDLDVNALPFIPRIRYRAYQVGTKFLNGVDYLGGGLANFFGITNDKFDTDTVEKIRENSVGVINNNNVFTNYPQNGINGIT